MSHPQIPGLILWMACSLSVWAEPAPVRERPAPPPADSPAPVSARGARDRRAESAARTRAMVMRFLDRVMLPRAGSAAEQKRLRKRFEVRARRFEQALAADRLVGWLKDARKDKELVEDLRRLLPRRGSMDEKRFRREVTRFLLREIARESLRRMLSRGRKATSPIPGGAPAPGRFDTGSGH